MPRVNNVIQQVSQLNTYEQEKVFDFLKTVLMSNGITDVYKRQLTTSPPKIIIMRNLSFKVKTLLN